MITTAPIDKDRIKVWEDQGIYYFKGTPFLTGIGSEPIMEEIYKLLDKWGVKVTYHVFQSHHIEKQCVIDIVIISGEIQFEKRNA